MKRERLARRDVLLGAGAVLGSAILGGCGVKEPRHVGSATASGGTTHPEVFFTKDLSAAALLGIYSRIGKSIAGKATMDFFGNRIVYVNVLRNMSVDCDCAGITAAPPKAHDLGILASTDLLAIERASIDMVYALPEAELHDLKERIESRDGLHQLAHMKALKMGSDQYRLVTL